MAPEFGSAAAASYVLPEIVFLFFSALFFSTIAFNGSTTAVVYNRLALLSIGLSLIGNNTLSCAGVSCSVLFVAAAHSPSDVLVQALLGPCSSRKRRGKRAWLQVKLRLLWRRGVTG